MSESKYPPHPAANCFPMMEGDAYERHRDDVGANGLRIPIVLGKDDAQWKIIDGRNRQKACDETGRKPRYEYFEGDLDAIIDYVVSVNVARRHLNESQRGLAASKLANLDHGGARSSGKSAGCTQAKAAKMLNVSERTVRDAKTATERGINEIEKAIESGELAVSRAVEISKLTRDQQLDALNEAKNSEPTRQTKEQRDGMMSIALLLKESEVGFLRVLVEAGEFYASKDARAREGIKVLLKLAPMVRQ